MAYTGDASLLTLEEGKPPPECRMKDAGQCQDFVRRLIENDTKRGRVRAKVSGLTAGNPPYQAGKLRQAGRASAANINFGTGRSYLESGSGAFYDLSSQAPGMVSIETSFGADEKRLEYSRTMSEEADRIAFDDPEFDEDMQLSQWEMTLYGTGPLYFENADSVFPIAVGAGDLKVPERTRSKTERWDACVLIYDYYPPELFDFIKDETAATAVGWDVPFTRKVIENAMDVRQPDSTTANDWEYYQQQLKGNSLNYYDESKICRLAHVFWKEFDGRVTHAIVEREDSTNKGVQYLFVSIGRYANMKEAIHPMYFDRGQDGFHSGVTGLGVKQFGAMEYENRLLCNLMDKAFAPKILFKPGSAEAKEKFQIAQFGDWGLLPVGTEAVQSPIQGFLTDGLAMFRTSSELMRSNLSQYRQPVEMEKSGNPVTKFEKQVDVSQQSALSVTTFNKYYRQLDHLWREITRRLCNLNTTDERALLWQKRCRDKGVPVECFGRIEQVKAVRVVGGGNPFMRAQTTSELVPIMGRFPEDGQNNLINDYIASRAGQSAIARYNRTPTSSKMATDQMFTAVEAIGLAKLGIPAPVTPSQNAVTFASQFIKAMTDAINSVRQGGDPNEVLQFCHTLGPVCAAHLQRIEKDPLRKPVFDALMERFQQVGKLVDQLQKLVKANAEKMKAQRQKTQSVLTDEQIKQRKLMGDEQRKNAKTKFQLQRDAAKTKMSLVAARQNLMINDARTASEISLSHAKAANEARLSRMKSFKE